MPRVNIEGVGSVNFPDTMTPEQITAAIERDILPQAKAPKPSAPMPEPKTALGQLVTNLLRSGGSPVLSVLPNFPDLQFGAKQALDAAAQMAARGASPALRAVGLPDGVSAAEAANAQGLADYKATNPETRLGAEIFRGLGNSAPITAATGGASFGPGLLKTAATGAGYGGASGFLTPVYDAENDADFWKKKGIESVKGAAIGGATAGGLNVVGRAISPVLAKGADLMADSGISTTIGQRLGGIAKGIEDRLAGFPIIGDLINKQRLTGISDFNRAVYRKALEPLGPEAVAVADKAPVGNEGVKVVGDYLSSSYEKALAKSRPNVIDNDFKAGIEQLGSMVPQSQGPEFLRIITQQIAQKVTSGGTLTPSAAKAAESELGRLAAGYRGSSDMAQRELGLALTQAQAELRGLVARNNAEMAPIIQATNDGWATLVQMENAAKMAGARKDGIFTPAQFLAGVQKSDKTVRDRAFSRGEVKNQEFAQAAQQVLPNAVPDSGTAGRNALAALGIGGAGQFGVLTPELAAGAGIASLPYLPGVGPAVTSLLTSRPASVATLGDLLKRAAPYLAPAGVAASSPVR